MSDLSVIEPNDIQLPALSHTVLPAITALTSSLNIPRAVLASDQEISYAWRDLPRELREIPESLRGELIARMCIAVSTGLFDGAMNYIWNAAILHLRDKIRTFGLPIVASIQGVDFEERNLVDLQDSRLLELCLKLNIIDEDGFFFLDQCRSIRNNFSAAHPTMGSVNDREFTTFLNRCIRYALADSASPRGVNISEFISALKGARLNDSQLLLWVERLTATHEAQRKMLINMIFSIYCDPATPEQARLNGIDLCNRLREFFTSDLKSDLINAHTDFIIKGNEEKRVASLRFFETLGLISLLTDSEQHSIYSKAIGRLWTVHNGMNNFYTEAPFAERLFELSQQGAIPDTVQEQFVDTIACCRVGNGYGVANSAVGFYNKLIQGFSSREIELLMLLAANPQTALGKRLSTPSCRHNFREMLSLIDIASVPNGVRNQYEQFIR